MYLLTIVKKEICLKLVILPYLLLAGTGSLQAQILIGEEEEKKKISYDSLLMVSGDLKPTLEVNPGAIEEKKKKAKKKKRKKKVFYGEKTKRIFTRDLDRRSRTYIFQRFHILKEPAMPDKFVRNIYYYSHEKKAIEKTPIYKPEYGPLLHGSYQRIIDGQVVERGLFYYGTKDGRWEKYTGEQLLLDKSYYYHGHPKNSEISFYDENQKKLKEVVPVQYDDQDGLYIEYYESGRIKTEGQYVNNVKVGRWIEYYDRNRPNVKRVTLYKNPNRPYDKEYEPYIEREYDEKGTLVIDNRKKAGRKF